MTDSAYPVVGVEKMRPFLVAGKLYDAAIRELQLGDGGAWGTISQLVQQKKIATTSPTLEFTFKTDDLRGQLKAFSHQKLADEECLARTVELTEALSNKQVEDARTRAWAMGDLAKLQELPPLPDPEVSCEQAIVNALAMTTPVPTDLREQMDELWFAAAGKALTKNESTLAFVPMSALLGERGYLENLRNRYHRIQHGHRRSFFYVVKVRNILPYASYSPHVIFSCANNSRVYRSLSDTTLNA